MAERVWNPDYQPGSIRTVKHFLEVSANMPRDTDECLWRLWLEAENVDIVAWAKRHLASGLKELGQRRSEGGRLLQNRVPTAKASRGPG